MRQFGAHGHALMPACAPPFFSEMKNKSLAARYRPQKFSEVIGQQMAITALSRAAATDRVAPAYLLSGTRGVGKTTVARIFAKALNCEHAPAEEPCNECGSCSRITAGNHVDVNEIDGASNTGVDDVRALRENIGYLPMEGRYKIFIIDEAHMLSKSAFNALLKTLEEPPPRTVFMFATTEVHRFPATIVSRCQHYVFRHLPEETIFKHLCGILDREGIEHAEGAVRMIARRASGSARDSLSLLDQALSMTGGNLAAEATREALGLAGQDFFQELFPALAQRKCDRILALTGRLLGSGVDIGFFMRDLAANLRNLFLLRQMGDGILPALGVSGDEGAFLREQAALFGVAHLHAAWQMAIESQRSITQSLEPGAALELLLINLAMLPRLLPVDMAASQSNAQEVAPYDSKVAQSADNRTPKPEESPKVDNELLQPQSAVNNETNWEGFCSFCRARQTEGQESLPGDILRHVSAQWGNGGLLLEAGNASLGERLAKKKQLLERLLAQYAPGQSISVHIKYPPPPRSHQDLLKECAEKPELQLCARILGATITDCHEKNGQTQES